MTHQIDLQEIRDFRNALSLLITSKNKIDKLLDEISSEPPWNMGKCKTCKKPIIFNSFQGDGSPTISTILANCKCDGYWSYSINWTTVNGKFTAWHGPTDEPGR